MYIHYPAGWRWAVAVGEIFFTTRGHACQPPRAMRRVSQSEERCFPPFLPRLLAPPLTEQSCLELGASFKRGSKALACVPRSIHMCTEPTRTSESVGRVFFFLFSFCFFAYVYCLRRSWCLRAERRKRRRDYHRRRSPLVLHPGRLDAPGISGKA